ncbi:MAG: hypothetical protein QM740_15095 [Acidovorax sp.]
MTAPSSPSPAASCDEEYSLPCAEALLAGTLALMTGFAQAGDAGQRDALRGKIVASLHNLSALATLTPHFRTLLANLGERWACPSCLPSGPDEAEALSAAQRQRLLWLAAPSTVQ